MFLLIIFLLWYDKFFFKWRDFIWLTGFYFYAVIELTDLAVSIILKNSDKF